MFSLFDIQQIKMYILINGQSDCASWHVIKFLPAIATFQRLKNIFGILIVIVILPLIRSMLDINEIAIMCISHKRINYEPVDKCIGNSFMCFSFAYGS